MNTRKIVGLYTLIFLSLTLPPAVTHASTAIDNMSGYFLIGNLHEDILTLSGVTSGITVDTGGGIMRETGTITLTLDPLGNSYFEYNLDQGTIYERLELLLTFPLQNTLGIGPLPIFIEETGTISSVTVIAGYAGDVTAELSHSGFITQPGSIPQPTTGSWTGTASQPVVDPIAYFRIESTLAGGGMITDGLFADTTYGNVQIKVNIGTGAGNGNIMPEPSTLFLLLIGSFAASKFRREKR